MGVPMGVQPMKVVYGFHGHSEPPGECLVYNSTTGVFWVVQDYGGLHRQYIEDDPAELLRRHGNGKKEILPG